MVGVRREYFDSKNYILSGTFYYPVFVFTVLPVIISIYLSFTYYNMLEAPKWVGWQNYIGFSG